MADGGYAQPQIFVRYIADDGEQWDDSYCETTPVAGQFILTTRAAYRIDEVWDVQEKHGAVPYGLTVFLTTVDVMDHRLGKSAPDYYSG
ncbi:hypothetical protein GCM10022377_10490 [Zhihengliuella alba]|uniref:Transposase n=1 Tax=Zhihengliuella alba TaxID=547018 RepID=A0ABP7D4P5_9MICC